jgi:chromatin segregation and condensation protein Rec8/ScpA/Scc1 (kleisin family)
MTVKKTAKKITKRTAAKKALPKPRRLTVDEFANILAGLAEGHAKTEASIRKLSAENRKLSAKNQELSVKVAEDHAKTEASIRELSAENRKLSAEAAANHARTEAVIAESRKSVDAELKSLSADVRHTSTVVRELSKNLGNVGNSVGELTEFIVIPKIRLAMNATGKHAFDSVQTDRIFKHIDESGEKKMITEIDVLLSGDTESMAVETKTHPLIRDVKKHQERLEILRRHEESAGIKGKKLFGAVAGAIVDPDVKAFALERGLYVVKIREEENKLDIAEPEQCRTW